MQVMENAGKWKMQVMENAGESQNAGNGKCN